MIFKCYVFGKFSRFKGLWWCKVDNSCKSSDPSWKIKCKTVRGFTVSTIIFIVLWNNYIKITTHSYLCRLPLDDVCFTKAGYNICDSLFDVSEFFGFLLILLEFMCSSLHFLTSLRLHSPPPLSWKLFSQYISLMFVCVWFDFVVNMLWNYYS